MSYSYSDRVRLDRYAVKDPAAALKPGDMVVVSIQRKSPDGKPRESREIGTVVDCFDTNTFTVEVPAQSAEVADAAVVCTNHSDNLQLLYNVPRHCLEYIVEKDWATICNRVGHAVLEVDKAPDAIEFADRISKNMTDGKFIPAGRVLSGLGRTDQHDLTVYNCYVFAIPGDSRTAITKHWGRIFDTFSRGGGVGWDLSVLRPKGAVVKKVNGRSSGVISWAEQFSQITGTVEQGGSRRGASLQGLWCWHPDIYDFVNAKSLREDFEVNGQKVSRNKNLLCNSNVSVLVTNAFMDAVKKDKPWDLIFPDLDDPEYDDVWTGDIDAWREAGKKILTYKTVQARDLWNFIITKAWEAGEPGLLFMERANELSNSSYFSKLVASNPCVTGDTRLHTQYGLVTVKELYESQADVLCTVDTRTLDKYQAGTIVRPSTPVFKTSDAAKVFSVQTKAGYTIKATEWHEFYTAVKPTVRRTDVRKVKLSELKVGDNLLIQMVQGQFGNEGSKELGAVLGSITGDGHITYNQQHRPVACLAFWGRDTILAPMFAEFVGKLTENVCTDGYYPPKVPNVCRLQKIDKCLINSRALADVLARYNFTAETKLRVPEVIWKGTKECVTYYLRSLFQADGTVNVADNKGRCSVRLSSSYPDLLYDVQKLLINFGIQSRVCKRRDAAERMMPDGKGGQKLYHCRANYELLLGGKARDLFMREIGFLHADKNNKFTAWAENKILIKSQKFYDKIVSITYVGEEPVYDVTQPDRNSVIFNGLVTGQCAEQPLSSNSVCNLSHVNLARFCAPGALPSSEATAVVAAEHFKWEEFGCAVEDGVRFLDDVIDLNKYHDAEIEKQQSGERRVGLGVLGYGEMLLRLGLRYGSEAALTFTDGLFARFWHHAYTASNRLAQERGAFPQCDNSKLMASGFLQQAHITANAKLLESIKLHGLRNVTVTTVAPTGSIGALLETTGGIEPYFDLQYTSTTRIGTVEEKANVVDLLSKQFGSEPNWPSYVVTAQKGITPEQHVKTQAVAQKWICSSISKTINVPNSATVQDVATAYQMMWDLGCKGGTVYRDGSRDEQVFYTKTVAAPASVPIDVSTSTLDAMRPRLEVGIGPTFSVPSPVGSLHVTIRHDPKTGDPEDIFITSGKGDITADVQAIGRLCSLILRLNGVPLSQQSKLELVREQLAGIPGRTQDGLPGQVRVSMPDTIAHVIERYLEGNFPLANMPFGAAQVDDLCKDFAAMPQDTLGKLAVYLKNQRASTPEPQAEQEDHDGRMFMLDLCPKCGTMSYQITGSCGFCHACTYSRCG